MTPRANPLLSIAMVASLACLSASDATGVVYGRVRYGSVTFHSGDDTPHPTVPIVPIFLVPPSGGFPFPARGHDYLLLGGPGSGSTHGLAEFPRCASGHCSDRSIVGERLLRCLLEFGDTCTAGHLGTLVLASGSHTEVVRSAIRARFARDTDAREGIRFAEYHGNTARVVILPLTTAPSPGADQVRMEGYARFFLKAIPRAAAHDSLLGEFISLVVIGP